MCNAASSLPPSLGLLGTILGLAQLRPYYFAGPFLFFDTFHLPFFSFFLPFFTSLVTFAPITLAAPILQPSYRISTLSEGRPIFRVAFNQRQDRFSSPAIREWLEL